ncbi:MAG: sugar nucleotide-binding protein [Gemmataceae bacterium]|nr:sugar nucleotide-binding protein [Gemmataceae bacterium]
MLPLLVTGISGVAGYNAFLALRALHPGSVVGLRPPATARLVGEGVVALDADDEAGLEALFRARRFRAVLNATGNCALKACELDPALAARTNVASAANVARLCARSGARLVHLSSDLVFSGSRAGNYAEDDPTDPVTVYGKTMAEGERLVRSLVRDAAILRISLPMGPSFSGHAGAIDWIDSRFRAGRPATLYYDEVRSATYCDDLNGVFAQMLANGAAGLFHCGGPKPITLHQIGQVVNRAGGYPPHLLHGCPRQEAGPVPPRAGDVSMDSGKLRRLLGREPFRPWPMGDDLWPAHRGWHAGEGWRGSRRMVEERLYRCPAG